MQYIQPAERIIMLLILIIGCITFNLSVVSTPIHILVFHRKVDVFLICLEENAISKHDAC